MEIAKFYIRENNPLYGMLLWRGTKNIYLQNFKRSIFRRTFVINSVKGQQAFRNLVLKAG